MANQPELDQDDDESIVDFSEDISSAERPMPLPKNKYRAQIVEASIKANKTDGGKYAGIIFHVPPEQYPVDFTKDGNPEGTKLRYNFVSLRDTPQARFGIRQFCEKIGVVPPGRQVNNSYLASWVGHEALVEVSHAKSQSGDFDVAEIRAVEPA